MGKFALIQAFYCICGIAFFVKELFEKVEMTSAMIRAFIWPYAQWPFIKQQALSIVANGMQALGLN